MIKNSRQILSNQKEEERGERIPLSDTTGSRAPPTGLVIDKKRKGGRRETRPDLRNPEIREAHSTEGCKYAVPLNSIESFFNINFY